MKLWKHLLPLALAAALLASCGEGTQQSSSLPESSTAEESVPSSQPEESSIPDGSQPESSEAS